MSPPRRILVVEDDERSRRLLRDVLEHHGYGVAVASSGEEGMRIAREHRPHAALLDIQLGGMSGFDVLRALRALPGPPIAVLAVTASVMDPDLKRIVEAGFDAYIPKPVNIRQVLDTLKDRLEQVSP